MIKIICITSLCIICIIRVLEFAVLNEKLRKLNVELCNVTRSEFKYRNLHNMLEYYMRAYNETNNTKQLIKNLNVLVYRSEKEWKKLEK